MHTQLLILANIFSESQIVQVGRLLSARHVDWMSDTSTDEHQRMMFLREEDSQSIFSDIDLILGDKFRDSLIPLITRHFDANSLNFTDIRDGSANKYMVGQRLAIHNDGKGNTERYFTDKRIDLAVVLYLNDDYEGGEFVLYNDISSIKENNKNKQFLTYGEIVNSASRTALIKPQRGTIIVIGADVLHEVLPISDGEKIILSWQMQIEH